MSEAGAKVFPERSSPWRRWEPSAFQPRHAAGECAAEPAVPAPPSAAEISRLIAQARQDAVAAGRLEGLAQGRTEGAAAGQIEGLERGKQSGYEEGYALALEQARAEVTDERQHLRALLDACANELAAVEEQIGASLIELALDVARQVVRRELAHRPDTVCAVVSEILHSAPVEQPALKIWLNPADVELVRTYLQFEHAHAKWRLFPDASLARGGCRAESAHGAIDATLQTRWQRVAAGLGRESLWIDSPLYGAPDPTTLPEPKARRAVSRKSKPAEA